MSESLRRDGLELRAEARLDRIAQQGALGLAEIRVALQEVLGARAGALEQLGHAVLAGAENISRPAQLEVDLGQPKAVALARDRLEAGQARVAEQDAERGMLPPADPPPK